MVKETEVEEERKKHSQKLMKAFKAVDRTESRANHLQGYRKGFEKAPAAICRYNTGLDTDLLKYIGAASVRCPPSFSFHPHLKKTQCEARVGTRRPSQCQDIGRGTFAHRHVILVDQKTDRAYIPLNKLEKQRNFIEVANNPLSEEAVLGFEYGFSLDSPKRMCIWEAQFGDFFNGAQIIIDAFLASGESKWLIQSGLTLLLPHGFDGAGPEHSSCRVERFLQLCDSSESQKPHVDAETVNLRVANPTTAAQYFDPLRRQQLPNYRKSLIVVAPKILLRHPKAASKLDDFEPGTYWREVIEDVYCDKDLVERVIFVSGKFWLDVEKEVTRRELRPRTAIIRLEQLGLFPVLALSQALAMYPKARDHIWAQEEPRNAGCWSFVKPRFKNALGVNLRYAGRPELAWTASAVAVNHHKELEQVLKDIFDR